MIIVYTKDLCGYCHMAMKYLKENEIEFEEINLDHNPDAKAYMISEGHTTVPQIYNKISKPGRIYEELLVEGGCNELLALSKEEILEKTLMVT